MPGRDRSEAPIGLRTKDSPMPAVGEKSLLMTASRVAALTGPPRSRYAVESVMDAPAPSNCWYVVPSLTVMVWLAVPPAEPNEKLGCWARPRARRVRVRGRGMRSSIHDRVRIHDRWPAWNETFMERTRANTET